jgi:histidinol-phosphatase (PHP family)
MSWSNYHGHCHYCDGKGAPEEYITAALDFKMPVLGISCHAPVPFETTWTMPEEKLPLYVSEMQSLKNQYAGRIKLLTALEVDYIPGLAGPLHPRILSAGIDYVVGSVHYVEAFETGEHWSIDNNNTEFEKGVVEIFQNDVRRAVKRYFNLQQEMCANETPAFLGHMDKIKMHNLVKPHFNEASTWYLSMVYETLSLAVEKEIIVEINTKYFDRAGLLFPGKEHFKWMKQNGVRVSINSDAHKAESVLSGFTEVASLLKQAGYQELWQWTGNGFSPRGFKETGIIW